MKKWRLGTLIEITQVEQVTQKFASSSVQYWMDSLSMGSLYRISLSIGSLYRLYNKRKHI